MSEVGAIVTDDLGDERLIALLRTEIAASGPLSFARFMELALLHPEHGYYSQRAAIGRQGDFVTAPELHAVFGRCLAAQVAELWVALGEPAPLSLLEWGAGTGALARDLQLALVRRWPALAARLDYAIHEVSPQLIEHQRSTLMTAGLTAHWTTLAAPTEGLLLANEVLDALPVHRVTVVDGRLRELVVDWQAGDFRESMVVPTTPALADYLNEGRIELAEGQIAEINLAALDWLDAVADRLERGVVLIVDYGDTTEQLYSRRRFRGTLLCYAQQRVNEQPFRRIGRQDITAHVDFGALARRARWRGLQVAGLTSQGAFLAGLGLGEALIELQDELAPAEYVRQREAIAALIRPDRLGRFKVLILTRGLPAGLPLAGLSVRL
jgi:SAM-dependent MidA family methyltransferase